MSNRRERGTNTRSVAHKSHTTTIIGESTHLRRDSTALIMQQRTVNHGPRSDSVASRTPRPTSFTCTSLRRSYTIVAAVVISAIWLCAAAAAEPPLAVFTNDDGAPLSGEGLQANSTRGDIQLHWKVDPATDRTPIFRLIGRLDGELVDDRIVYYEGPQQRSFISGLENGTHEFVVVARFAESDPWGPESEPLRFTVEHHSLIQTFVLLGIGAFLFIAIVFVVVREAIFAKDPFAGEDDGPEAAPTEAGEAKGGGA